MKYKNPRLKYVKEILSIIDLVSIQYLSKETAIKSIRDQCNLLLETKKKKCEYLKKRETVYLRSYCEAGCDCPNCHRGDGADRVRDCVYCQLKWKNKGQYNAKKYPKFAKDRKPFIPSPQPNKCDLHRTLDCPYCFAPQPEIERVNVHIKGGLFTGKQVYKVDELVETINALVDQVNKLTKTK